MLWLWQVGFLFIGFQLLFFHTVMINVWWSQAGCFRYLALIQHYAKKIKNTASDWFVLVTTSAGWFYQFMLTGYQVN